MNRQPISVLCHCGSPMEIAMVGNTDDLYICTAETCSNQVNIDWSTVTQLVPNRHERRNDVSGGPVYGDY